MNRTRTRLAPLAAGLAATALTLMSAAPATAAVVSRAGATAIEISIAGNGQGSGTVTATNDGSKETKTGETTSPVSVLKGQSIINAGVLVQQATAKPGGSAACAGLAGNGQAPVEVGDSDCLNPGTPVQATLGTLDLSNLVVVDPNSALAGLNPLLDPVLAQLKPIVKQVTDNIGSQYNAVGLTAGFGALEGRCTASNGEATGSANLADATISVTVPGKTLNLVTLPVRPAPNTPIDGSNLSALIPLITDAVTADLNAALDGAGSPLGAGLKQFQDAIVTNVTSQLDGKLAPLRENLFSGTLNRQDTSVPGAIKVAALDLQLLPVVKNQLGSSLVQLVVGAVACGPADAVSPPRATPTPGGQAGPVVPRAVSSGLAEAPGSQTMATADVVGLALLALSGLGLAGFGWVRLRQHLG